MFHFFKKRKLNPQNECAVAASAQINAGNFGWLPKDILSEISTQLTNFERRQLRLTCKYLSKLPKNKTLYISTVFYGFELEEDKWSHEHNSQTKITQQQEQLLLQSSWQIKNIYSEREVTFLRLLSCMNKIIHTPKSAICIYEDYAQAVTFLGGCVSRNSFNEIYGIAEIIVPEAHIKKMPVGCYVPTYNLGIDDFISCELHYIKGVQQKPLILFLNPFARSSQADLEKYQTRDVIINRAPDVLNTLRCSIL